jgi:hypothetical protein
MRIVEEEEHLAWMRGEYGISSTVVLRLPKGSEDLVNVTVKNGIVLAEDQLWAGLRLPFPRCCEGGAAPVVFGPCATDAVRVYGALCGGHDVAGIVQGGRPTTTYGERVLVHVLFAKVSGGCVGVSLTGQYRVADGSDKGTGELEGLEEEGRHCGWRGVGGV